ncbi:uncharacterized protein LOC136028152 isoform X3 [Artemia franciscana]|uniref:uncharacterized protein LOC136028152 isoform X3 n=1 Tax=Artemia franciscana TaxID=6661 RepID=UPI0032D9FA1B
MSYRSYMTRSSGNYPQPSLYSGSSTSSNKGYSTGAKPSISSYSKVNEVRLPKSETLDNTVRSGYEPRNRYNSSSYEPMKSYYNTGSRQDGTLNYKQDIREAKSPNKFSANEPSRASLDSDGQKRFGYSSRVEPKGLTKIPSLSEDKETKYHSKEKASNLGSHRTLSFREREPTESTTSCFYNSLPRNQGSEKTFTSRFLKPQGETPVSYLTKKTNEVKEQRLESTKDNINLIVPTYRPKYSRFLSSTSNPTFSRPNSSQDGFKSPTSPTLPVPPDILESKANSDSSSRLELQPVGHKKQSSSPISSKSTHSLSNSPEKTSSSSYSSSEEEEREEDFLTCRATSPNMYSCDPDPGNISAEKKVERSAKKLITAQFSSKEVQTDTEREEPRKSRFIGYTGYAGPSYSSYTPSRPTSSYYDKYLSRNYTTNLTKYRDETKIEDTVKKSPSPLAMKPPLSPSISKRNGESTNDIKEKIKAGILDVLMYTSMAGKSLERVQRSSSKEKTSARIPAAQAKSRSPSVEYQLKPPVSPSSRPRRNNHSPSSEMFGKPPVSPLPRKISNPSCLSKSSSRCSSISSQLPTQPKQKRQSLVSKKSSSGTSSESESESSIEFSPSSKSSSISDHKNENCQSSSEEETSSSNSGCLPEYQRNGSFSRSRLISNNSKSSLPRSSPSGSHSNVLHRNSSNLSQTELRNNVRKSMSGSKRGNLGSRVNSTSNALERNLSNSSRTSMIERSGSNLSRSSLIQRSGSNLGRNRTTQNPSNASSRRSSAASMSKVVPNLKRHPSKQNVIETPKKNCVKNQNSYSSKSQSSSPEVSKSSSSDKLQSSRKSLAVEFTKKSFRNHSPSSSSIQSRKNSIEQKPLEVPVHQSSFQSKELGKIQRCSTVSSDWWNGVPELSSSPDGNEKHQDHPVPDSENESTSSSELLSNKKSGSPFLPPPNHDVLLINESPTSELGDRTSPDGFEWPEESVSPSPNPYVVKKEKSLPNVEKYLGYDGEAISKVESDDDDDNSVDSESSESDEESLSEALSKAIGKEVAVSDEELNEVEDENNDLKKIVFPSDKNKCNGNKFAEVRLRRNDSSTENQSNVHIAEAEKLAQYLKRLDAVNRISDHLTTPSGDEVDDATLQVYKDGEYASYLDLECSLAEQADEIEGISDSRKNSFVLRTQLTVRVHAIIEKLLNTEGRELRRSLFALKQIFQDDKDLVHSFVRNDGLSCLVKVGKEADQNYQNYILRALGQVMLYVDGMHGVMENNETIMWLYELFGSRYRLVVKTALKLLLVFVEYAESNCHLLINAIHTVDNRKGQTPWSELLKLLGDSDATDTELVIYAVTLINKTLQGLPDQDSFYDETDCLEGLGMQKVIKKYLTGPGADLDLLQQFQLYEAELRREDGNDVPIGILPPIQPISRSKPRIKKTLNGDGERRKSLRHLLTQEDHDGRSSTLEQPRIVEGAVKQPEKVEEHDEDSVASSSRSNSPSCSESPKMQIDEPPLLRRRRQRADRQRTFLLEQSLRLGSDGESSLTDDSNASHESRGQQEINERGSPISISLSVETPNVPIKKLPSKTNLLSVQGLVEEDGSKRPIEVSREMSVKDITEKLKMGQSILNSPSEEKLGRIGDLSGIISKAKEGLTKSKSRNDLKAEPQVKVEQKKSENELHWEELVRSLNRPLQICDLDFTELRDEDDIDPLCKGLMNGIPPPPPPMTSGLPPLSPPMASCGFPPPLTRGFPPPPVFGVKLNHVKGQENALSTDLECKLPKKTKKTVKLFWKEARDGNTIWDDLNPILIDTQKLEYLFEQRSAKDITGKEKNADGLKSKEIIILDPKRSNAINIALTKLPPPRAIKAAILKMDPTVINREGIEKLLALLPSEEEKSKIQEAVTLQPDVPLGSAEQFLLTLSSIAELSARLKLWTFRLDYENSEKEIAEPLMDLKVGIDCLKSSRTFKVILATLLTIGNFLNGSQSKGFQIDYLAKVPEVKDTVHKHSLLHHLCSIVIEKYADTTDLYSEIGAVTRASRVDFDELAAALSKLESDCKASWDHLRAVGKHEQQLSLKTKISEFLSECAERIIVLGIIYRRVMHRFQSFMLWLGTPVHMARDSKPGAIFRIIAEFALEYRTTRERVLTQIEKRAAHRERNKTRGKLITEVGSFRREEDRADAELRHILASDMSDTESMSIRGNLSLSLGRKNKAGQRLNNFGRSTSHKSGTSDACTSDAEDVILESLVKTVTAPTKPLLRERKRTRHADRKSLKRSRTRENNVFLPLLEDPV